MGSTLKLVISMSMLLLMELSARMHGGTLAGKDAIAMAILMAGWIIATDEAGRSFVLRRESSEE